VRSYQPYQPCYAPLDPLCLKSPGAVRPGGAEFRVCVWGGCGVADTARSTHLGAAERLRVADWPQLSPPPPPLPAVATAAPPVPLPPVAEWEPRARPTQATGVYGDVSATSLNLTALLIDDGVAAASWLDAMSAPHVAQQEVGSLHLQPGVDFKSRYLNRP
jgi:hypothetical protein